MQAAERRRRTASRTTSWQGPRRSLEERRGDRASSAGPPTNEVGTWLAAPIAFALGRCDFAG